MKTFIAVYNNSVGTGLTLDLAWGDLCDADSDAVGECQFCNFYEAEEIQVEQKIVKKTTIIKTKKVS